MAMPTQHPYESLTPDLILDAVEAQGYWVTGRIQALNSYENRVYLISIEDGPDLVAKFYRPDRLSEAALLEEHHFVEELRGAGVEVLAPISNEKGETLYHHQGFRYVLYPRFAGRAPNLEDPDTLYRLGGVIGRLHQIGSQGSFSQRTDIGIDHLGVKAIDYLSLPGVIPQKYCAPFIDIARQLLERIRGQFANIETAPIRLHGDVHQGNILQHDDEIILLDTDDCGAGPAIQDLWILLSGERVEMQQQLRELVEGYEEYHPFPAEQLTLVEGLRTLRMVHYCAWLTRRWEDPAFPVHFPWFGSDDYWQGQLQGLQGQLSALEVPPITLSL